jgi:hypothetical protein
VGTLDAIRKMPDRQPAAFQPCLEPAGRAIN